MSKTLSKQIEHFFDVRFSSTPFVLSRFRVFLSDGSSKALHKSFYKKNRVEKLLQKNRPKNPKRQNQSRSPPAPPLGFVLSRFWALLS
jgi:hypothetical protein